jgi:type VI secretion system protein ImpL
LGPPDQRHRGEAGHDGRRFAENARYPVRAHLAHPIAKETSLDPPASNAPASGASDNLSALFKATQQAETPPGMAAAYADDHFKAIHQLVQVPANSGPDAQPPIDAAIADLGTVYRALSAGTGGAANPLLQNGESAGAVARLQAGTVDLPEPIKGWILGVGQKSSSLSADDMRGRLASLWKTGPGRLCLDVTRGRYPFFGSERDDDAPIGDFGRLFAAGGAIDTFFSQNLAPVVDMSQTPWRLRQGVGTGGVSLDPSALAQFQRAAAIRDGMFANGGNTPAISFELSIVSLDPAARDVIIDIDGQRLTYNHGAPVSLRMRWPAPAATGSASVTFDGGAPGTLTASGPWALFRLLGMSSVHRSGADRLQGTFEADGHAAGIILRPDSVLSPLDGEMLSQFRCPSTL